MALAIVAGAGGAIGQHVAEQLSAAGWRVAGLGHGPAEWAGAQPIDYWLAGDVSPANLGKLADQAGPAELIINLAGGSAVGPSVRDPAGDFARTVTTSINILDFIRTRSPEAKLVAASSAAVYGDQHRGPIAEDATLNPISPYGHHKLLMEQSLAFWGKAFGVSTAIVRLFSVYGVGLRKQMIFDLCTRLSAAPDQLEIWGTGAETRDWISIHDAARLLIEIAPHASTQAPVFNGCTGQARTVGDMARLLAGAWGQGSQITFDGIVRPGDPQNLVGSAERLNEIGFTPRVSLEQGLHEVVADTKLHMRQGL
jgi:UDP-glucose 4-epimerase